METTTIKITIQNGKALAVKDLLASDPFVEFGQVDESGAWLGKLQKTKVIRDTINPVWMQSFDIILDPKAVAFKFVCWDHDAIGRPQTATKFFGSNDHMGWAEIKVVDMKMTEIPVERSIVLKPKKPTDYVCGHLTVLFTRTTPAYLQEQAELARKAAEEEDELVDQSAAAHVEIDIEKIRAAANAFSRSARTDGVIKTPEHLEEFMDRMQMTDLVYCVLRVERPYTVNDESFEEVALTQEFLVERREAMFRIFDANNDGNITWQEVLESLAMFADTTDLHKKYDIQFEIWDINADGSLSFEELQKSMNHTFKITANMIRVQFPKQVRMGMRPKYKLRLGPARNTQPRSSWTEADKEAFAAACEKVLREGDFGGEFASALFSHLGKKKDEKISKAEFISAMIEKASAIEDVRAGIVNKIGNVVAMEAAKNRQEKMAAFYSTGYGKFQMNVANSLMSRAMPMTPYATGNTSYTKGVPQQIPGVAPGNMNPMMPMDPRMMGALPPGVIMRMQGMQGMQGMPGAMPGMMPGGMPPMY